MSRVGIAFLLVLLAPSLTPAHARTTDNPSPRGNWLYQLNFYRDMADLPPVRENKILSNGGRKHAKYIVKNDAMGHFEDPVKPWYTPEGDKAARNSNLHYGYGFYRGETEKRFIDSWMRGPFHALGLIDPRVYEVGFGSYQEAIGKINVGAALDVSSGFREELPSPVTFPIKWPGGGTYVNLQKLTRERPDPLTSSPGYIAPTGLPIILQLGSGNLVPNVTASSFKDGDKALAHFTIDETNYRNPNKKLQDTGRWVLGARDAIVLMPKEPLQTGHKYTVSISANGQTHQWSFEVGDDRMPPTGSIKIDGCPGDRRVILRTSASDKGGSGLYQMRFKNEDGLWSQWYPFASRKSWVLSLGDGKKRVLAEFRDRAGNLSPMVSKSLFMNTSDKSARINTPFVSTKISKTSTFKVSWCANDPTGKIDSYGIRYRPANSPVWRDWKAETKNTYGYFQGKAGRTYYFRVRAKGAGGKTWWSKSRKTIVPYNEGANIMKKIGFFEYEKNGKSSNYLSSARYSYKSGYTLAYRLENTNGIGLVTTKSSNRGRAKIYVDGKYIETVDAYSSKHKPRQLIFYNGFSKKGTHFLKIINEGTPGRARFDVDAIVAGH